MTHSPLNNHFMESLDFSDTAKQLEALKAIIFDVAKTNEVKIQFIKEELAANRYLIRNHHIAEQMLEYTAHVHEEIEMA